MKPKLSTKFVDNFVSESVKVRNNLGSNLLLPNIYSRTPLALLIEKQCLTFGWCIKCHFWYKIHTKRLVTKSLWVNLRIVAGRKRRLVNNWTIECSIFIDIAAKNKLSIATLRSILYNASGFTTLTEIIVHLWQIPTQKIKLICLKILSVKR